MNQEAQAPRGALEIRKRQIESSLQRRHRTERTFRAVGLAAVIMGLGFVALLFATILAKGLPAFWQATVTTEVFFDPAVIKVEARPVRAADENPQQFRDRELAWLNRLGMVNWNRIIEDTLITHLPDAAEKRPLVRQLVTSGERFKLRDMVAADPGLIGKRAQVELLADANVDVWLKGNIDRSLDDSQQQLRPEVRAWADELKERGVIQNSFNTSFFVNPDSRSSLASAGLGGAFIGTLYMMAIVIFLSVPIGVLSALYLEEFAPRNRFTDLIEVNINNLAAVPSIIFGLLGAAVFINWLHLPLSAPLVGGLVLSLMTLPTVIIATRSALKAIPPSIRQAALGIGASKMQTMFHHVLPLAMPGILTGAIIGVAQAIGETAPLLLIGMSAFVATLPVTPLDQSAALPVQIYLWQGNELRNFFEARTSAAIIVLLALMLSLNALAIWLRKKFERRW
ncbi:MAG TPA: phosphate ABC transporter permease PstA [Rhodocyclaceae bacterium]|nr:phosphate ABC transporter permease PstA [Rhodocyclaceae bacterium]